jgi:glutathione synthase/RimK-type ligase-like ATP-grasp enzyme
MAAFLSSHARYAEAAARACGFVFRSLDGEDGYLFEVCDGRRCATFAAGAGSPYAMNDTRAASIARDKAFCAIVLREAGVAVVPGAMFFATKRWADMRLPGREPEDALVFARAAAYPLFCKPIAASNGLHAEIVENSEGFAEYLSRVGREHFAILAQPYIRAPEHRVFVLNGQVLAAYRKSLPAVVGDGISTLAALSAPLGREHGVRARDAAGRVFAAGDVAPNGARLTLEGPANRAAGGGGEALSDAAPQALGALALSAASALGLGFAAVDMFDAEPGPMVIEVNSNPMIATLEEHGRWDLIHAIWRANFNVALR